MAREVILASASLTRAGLLRNAGVVFASLPPMTDEEALKREFAALAPSGLAVALAERKALSISAAHAQAIVIGADQVTNFQGGALGKPESLEAALERLRAMRGKPHVLETAAVCAVGGAIQWSHLARPELTMRDVSDGFLAEYGGKAGAGILSSAGAYQLEGLGAQLFERIEGDYFAILGLPLLPLLAYLRAAGALAR